MVFIMGVNIPENRPVKKALQRFYGIGVRTSKRIMARLHIHDTARLGSLTQAKSYELTSELSNMKIENELRRELRENIARLRDIGSYRGRRHAMNLPVRGQNTRTQTNTAIKLNRVERRG